MNPFSPQLWPSCFPVMVHTYHLWPPSNILWAHWIVEKYLSKLFTVSLTLIKVSAISLRDLEWEKAYEKNQIASMHRSYQNRSVPCVNSDL